MQLIELTRFVENDLDKAIINIMLKETEDTLYTRIGNIIYNSICAFDLDMETKNTVKYTIRGYNADSFGGVAAFTFLLPFYSMMHKGEKENEEIIDQFLTILVRYFARYIGKADFVKSIWLLQESVGISDKFYDNMVDYFGSKKDSILGCISQKLDLL